MLLTTSRLRIKLPGGFTELTTCPRLAAIPKLPLNSARDSPVGSNERLGRSLPKCDALAT